MNAIPECAQTLLVQADFDGELDAAQSAALVRHREACAQCQAVQEQLVQARALLRAAPRYAVSPQLRARLVRERRPMWRAPVGWAAAAAAIALVAVGVSITPRSSDIGGQLVSNHLRAMQLDSHLIDVVSSDHHTVKPWFAGKVDFAPPVKQLEADGYVLKGGRIDIVEGRAAAVLVYQAGRHTVEVFIWPARGQSSTAFQARQLDGFNLQHWEEGGLEIWSISDMAAGELERFASRWRAAS